jgi:hypothetical protein
MKFTQALETTAAEIALYLASEEREDLIGPVQSIVLEIMSNADPKVIDAPVKVGAPDQVPCREHSLTYLPDTPAF